MACMATTYIQNFWASVAMPNSSLWRRYRPRALSPYIFCLSQLVAMWRPFAHLCWVTLTFKSTQGFIQRGGGRGGVLDPPKIKYPKYEHKYLTSASASSSSSSSPSPSPPPPPPPPPRPSPRPPPSHLT